jgi:predicted CoA-binding protein
MIKTPPKATLVLGASTNPERYSFKAVHALLGQNLPVIPLGVKKGSIAGIEIINDRPEFEGVDTVTLYINSNVQQDWQEYILSLNPRRIIFNPGTENPEFYARAQKLGIDVQEVCTLVLLATIQF